MMIDEIERAVKEQCRICDRSKTCDKPGCFVKRVKSIMTFEDQEIAKINIDDFFEEQIQGQMSMW